MRKSQTGRWCWPANLLTSLRPSASMGFPATTERAPFAASGEPSSPGNFLERELVTPDESVPAIEERDEADHELLPWDEHDLKRLGLKPDTEAIPQPQEDEEPPSGKPFRVYRGGKPTASRRALP